MKRRNSTPICGWDFPLPSNYPVAALKHSYHFPGVSWFVHPLVQEVQGRQCMLAVRTDPTVGSGAVAWFFASCFFFIFLLGGRGMETSSGQNPHNFDGNPIGHISSQARLFKGTTTSTVGAFTILRQSDAPRNGPL